MSWQKYAYHIFSPEGTLLPIEHALECVNNSLPILVYRQKDSIICISKKPPHDKLQIPQKPVHKVTNSSYTMLTGYEPDLLTIKSYLAESALNIENKLGHEPTADIIARIFADKIQNNTQKSGKRPYAFGAFVFGFEENCVPYLYYVDNSAVLVPIYAMCVGEHSSKVNGFLEKNVGYDEGLEISVEGMCQALGYDFGPNDIEMCVVDKNGITWFDNNEVDDLLVKISEKN